MVLITVGMSTGEAKVTSVLFVIPTGTACALTCRVTTGLPEEDELLEDDELLDEELPAPEELEDELDAPPEELLEELLAPPDEDDEELDAPPDEEEDELLAPPDEELLVLDDELLEDELLLLEPGVVVVPLPPHAAMSIAVSNADAAATAGPRLDDVTISVTSKMDTHPALPVVHPMCICFNPASQGFAIQFFAATVFKLGLQTRVSHVRFFAS